MPAGTRVAYVDMKRLIDSSPQFLRARERLLREFEAASNLLREDEARVSGLEIRLREAQQQGNRDAEAAVLAELEPLRRSVERTRDRLLRELEARSEQEVERAWPLINDSVAEFARDQGIDIVVSSGVAYVSGRTDITDRVLDRLQRADAARDGR
ncbi:MAG: OmpH family outer membrane protein [Aquimonas sp.]|nr:OmpH family outer membrane protein [Aquimonas sp.]